MASASEDADGDGDADGRAAKRARSAGGAELRVPARGCADDRPAGLSFACRHVVAPMVGCSDLAFRLLCRRHGADVAYTEMLFADRIVDDPEYRQRKLTTCEADRPLVVQLCGTDPHAVAAAAALVAPSCDAVDINLGCPLPQAAAGKFGAYCERSVACAIVRAVRGAVALPVFAKIRLLDSLDETLGLCAGLEDAGVALIAVHARHKPEPTRHRGQRSEERADMEAVRSIASGLRVPVIANGNTECRADVDAHLAMTGAAGVMSAEGILRNPRLFKARETAAAERRDLPRDELGAIALEYLSLAAAHPPEKWSVVRGHIMWMLGKSGKGHRCDFEHLGPYSAAQLRLALLDAASVPELETIVTNCTGVAGHDSSR